MTGWTIGQIIWVWISTDLPRWILFHTAVQFRLGTLNPQDNYLFAVMAVSCCVCTALNTTLGYWTCLMLRKFFSKIYSFLKMQTNVVLLHSWTIPACACKTMMQVKNPALTLQGNEALQVSPHWLPLTRGSILAVPNWIILYFQRILSHTGQALSGLLCFSVQMSLLGIAPSLFYKSAASTLSVCEGKLCAEVNARTENLLWTYNNPNQRVRI